MSQRLPRALPAQRTNAINQLATTTNPMGYQTTNSYNAAGLLTATTDGNGRTIDYGYDAIGEETSETWVGGNYTATYQYNGAGELTEASDPFSTYTYTYDADGRETSVSNAGTPGVPAVTLTSTYDAFGDRTGLSDSLSGSISYSYDKDQRLTDIYLTAHFHFTMVNAQVSLAYDADSRVTGLTRTGGAGDTITTSFSYDNANELTNIADADSTTLTTLANYTYGYNAGGQVTSYQDNNNSSLTYGYDANGELTSASGTLNGSSYGVSYSYDANGNRNMTGYTTGAGNELTSDGTYNYTYDNVGNVLTQTNIATGSVTYYTWDYRNRLTEVKVETSGGTVLNDETFTYDVNNNRIGVSLNGTAQLYTVYDGSNAYMDFNGSGTLLQRYLANPNTLSQFYGQVSASGTVQWFLTDNINSIRQVIGTNGGVLDAITYDPFGSIVTQTNAANAPRMMYAGGAYDSISGSYLDGEREDDPEIGRWLSQDPLGFRPGDANLYRYVNNQPTYQIDPSGLAPPTAAEIKQIIRAIEGIQQAISDIDTQIQNSNKLISDISKKWPGPIPSPESPGLMGGLSKTAGVSRPPLPGQYTVDQLMNANKMLRERQAVLRALMAALESMLPPLYRRPIPLYLKPSDLRGDGLGGYYLPPPDSIPSPPK